MTTITKTNILERLGRLNLEKMEEYKMGREWLCLCPFHDDSKASFSVNTETGQWYCFSGCGGGSLEQLEEKVGERGQWAPMEPDPTPAPIRSQAPVLKSLLDRGFTREMLAPWAIVWDDVKGAMRIPVLNERLEVLANIWRFPEGVTPKYRYDAGFEKSACLFGLWKLPPMGQLILVEGTLDAVWLQAAGHPGVAILGSSLSAAQVHLLQLRNVKTVVMCLDNDAAGKEATVRAAALLRSSGFWVFKCKLPARFKDIQDVPFDEVTEVISGTEICINHSGLYAPRFQRWVQ